MPSCTSCLLYTSSSRFVRVAFTKVNAISGESEEESVSQFFHILGSVDQQRGCCEVEDGKYEITLYTSCCNVKKGIYYYNTYENLVKETIDYESLEVTHHDDMRQVDEIVNLIVETVMCKNCLLYTSEMADYS